MKALVVYESMYGNTHLVAAAIADGLRGHMEATLASVSEATGSLVAGSDVLIVGGPTHAHGMSRTSTRQAAVTAAEEPGSELVLDEDAELEACGPGLREWFDSLPSLSMDAAAFDTRVDLPVALTGRASKGIAHRLRHHGATLIAGPESFFVSKANHLEPDEEVRARQWGQHLGTVLGAAAEK